MRKRFKDLVSRRACRERQKVGRLEAWRVRGRRQKTEDRRQEKVGRLEGWLNIYTSTHLTF
ncbi:MAG: hypothetical protein KBH82_09020 [Syntrophorhabdaceae bacterium]|nr:hypothetical protein [Syntrophorhabdaceae bacterium]MDI9560866.1 hypothetical protein [Pseudomonadota bacterium]